MGPQTIGLTALITFLVTVLTPFTLNFLATLTAPLALAQTPDPRKAEANRLLKEGIQQFQTSQFEAAKQSWQQALTRYRELKDRRGEGQSLGNLGNAYHSLGNYAKAIEYHQQDLVIARELRDRRGEGQSLGNLGVAYHSLGNYAKAIEYHQQDLVITRELRDRQGERAALGNLGIAYYSLGDYAKAISYHQQDLALAREIKDRQGEGKALANLGLAYYFLGDYAKATEYHQQSLTLTREIKDRQGEGKALANLGIAYDSLGDYAKAISYQQQSLTLTREIKDRQSEGATLGNLGIAYGSLGDYAKAISYQQQSLAIAREIKDRQSEGEVLGNLGNAYYSLGDYAKAISYQQQSLAIAREIKDRQSEGEALDNLGLALQKFGKLALAERTLIDGINVWEFLRAGLRNNDANKVSIFEVQARTYRTLQQVLIAQNKTNAALEIAERGRARGLVELLARRLDLHPTEPSTTTPLTLSQIKQIASAQNSTLVQYSIIDDELKVQGKVQNRESELYIWVIKPTGEVIFRRSDLRPLWQQQKTTLAALVSSTRQSIFVRDRGNANELTPAIGDRVRLKDDAPGWEPWEVLSVNVQSGTLIVRLPSWNDGVKIERPVADVVGTVEASSTNNQQLQQLHQLLIQPIADLLPKVPSAHVTFIPQGALFLVPFPALQDTSGKYLVEQHTILTAPSIQVLALTRQQWQQGRQVALHDIIVLGNPTMPSVPSQIGEKPQPLASLPDSEREAKAIAPLLHTQAITGSEATKAAIVQRMPKARIIHLATHGLLDDVRGLGSAIALAPSGNDNGLLTAEEILNLRLNAELIVLSACNTGRGRITGDGVIGLSRSLISAGVPSVIVSLWSVPDAPTAFLMTEFYQHLFQPHSDKASALRQAMLTTMKQHPNPKDWASFTLIGEAE